MVDVPPSLHSCLDAAVRGDRYSCTKCRYVRISVCIVCVYCFIFKLLFMDFLKLRISAFSKAFQIPVNIVDNNALSWKFVHVPVLQCC